MTQKNFDERIVRVLTEVSELVVNRQFDELERRSTSKRVHASDIERTIGEFNVTPIMPPNWEAVQGGPVPGTQAWAIDMPLWTVEEGRSDLEVQLWITLNGDGTFSYEIIDFRML